MSGRFCTGLLQITNLFNQNNHEELQTRSTTNNNNNNDGFRNVSLFLFILLVFTTVSGQLLALVGLTEAHLASSEESNVNQLPPKLIVFSFDGFRPDYVNQTDTPNLYQMAKSGVRGQMRSQFVTKTYPNHQSIVTGLYEPNHGIINNKFIDPFSKHTAFDPDNRSTFWWDQFNASVPIYIANQAYEMGRFSGSMQWPGSIINYTVGETFAKARKLDPSRRYGIFYLRDYDKSDWNKRIDIVMQWLTDDRTPANCVFIYFAEPDSTAHNYGPFGNKTILQVKLLDTLVGTFQKRLSAAGLLHRTNQIFLSDHGMSEIHADRLLLLKLCDQYFPGLRYQMEGVSPVFNIVPLESPTKFLHLPLAQAVQTALNQCSRDHFGSHYRVYQQNEIPSVFHYQDNRRILPLFLVADDGYDVGYEDNGWTPAGYPVWGNHGYNNSLPSMRPLFIGHGRSFRRDYDNPTPFENIDLYPLMLRLLQIPVHLFPSNGSLARVNSMLTNQLFLDDRDFLDDYMDRSAKNQHSPIINQNKWIQLFVYLGIGFCAILFGGVCFVLTSGLGRSSSSSSSSSSGYAGFGGRSTSSKPNLLVRAIRRVSGKKYHQKGYYDSDYRMFSNSRPNTLDSSFDDDDDYNDELEDELFAQSNSTTAASANGRRKKTYTGRNGSGSGGGRFGSNSRLTDIDWDIIGTGLDIDLCSQLKPSLMSESRDYIGDNRSIVVDDDDDSGDSDHRPRNCDIIDIEQAPILTQSIVVGDNRDDRRRSNRHQSSDSVPDTSAATNTTINNCDNLDSMDRSEDQSPTSAMNQRSTLIDI